jgi:hypothetical protein
MNQNYTTEDLILYAYNETELRDSVRIQHSIDSDPLVEGEYKEIITAVKSLDRIMLEPDAKVMNRLMEFISA